MIQRATPVDLGIVIVNWNVRDLLAACLDSVYLDLAQSGDLRAAVCIVDNASTDGSVEMLRTQFSRTLLIESDNLGMGAGNNRGLRALQEQVAPAAFLILNRDTVVRPGALRRLVDCLHSHPRAGVVAPKLVNPDGTLQHSGFRFPGLLQAMLDLFPPSGRLARLINSPLNGRYPGSLYSAGQPFLVEHTLGAAFIVRAETVAEVGLFDETFQMYCEEIDWQWRMERAGWERWLAPAAEIVHYGGQSTAQVRAELLKQLWTSRRRLYQRYQGQVVNAVLNPLVQAGMRRRIRANFRRSQRGQMSADERAELNLVLNEIMQMWSAKRRRRGTAALKRSASDLELVPPAELQSLNTQEPGPEA